jgi:hypothetical protein
VQAWRGEVYTSKMRRFAYVMLRQRVLSARQRAVLAALAAHVEARRKKEEREGEKLDAVRMLLQTRTDAKQVLLRRALRHWCGWAAESSAEAQRYLACKDACMQELLYSQRQRLCAQLLAFESVLARALAAWCVGMRREELLLVCGHGEGAAAGEEELEVQRRSWSWRGAGEEELQLLQQEKRRKLFYSPNLTAAEEEEEEEEEEEDSRVTTSRDVINRLLGDVTHSHELVHKLLLKRALAEPQQSLHSALIEQ